MQIVNTVVYGAQIRDRGTKTKTSRNLSHGSFKTIYGVSPAISMVATPVNDPFHAVVSMTHTTNQIGISTTINRRRRSRSSVCAAHRKSSYMVMSRIKTKYAILDVSMYDQSMYNELSYYMNSCRAHQSLYGQQPNIEYYVINYAINNEGVAGVTYGGGNTAMDANYIPGTSGSYGELYSSFDVVFPSYGHITNTAQHNNNVESCSYAIAQMTNTIADALEHYIGEYNCNIDGNIDGNDVNADADTNDEDSQT